MKRRRAPRTATCLYRIAGLSLIVATGLPLTECSTSTSSSAGSCAGPLVDGAVGVCTDYAAGFTAISAKTACAGNEGTYSASPCATAGLLASCSETASGITVITRRYSVADAGNESDSEVIANEESVCQEAGGTFTQP